MSTTWKVLLIAAACLSNVADNITTYLCLSQYSDIVYEANPVADFFFARLGLASGLLVETLVSSIVIVVIGANLWFPEEKILGPFGRRNSSFLFLVSLTLLLTGVAISNAWIYYRLATGSY